MTFHLHACAVSPPTHCEKGLNAGNWQSKMYVYFIQGQSTRLVKIGITSGNVYSRLATIQANSPDTLKLLKAVKGDSKYESELHKRFASVRSHGEWFYPSRGLMAFIEGLKGINAKLCGKVSAHVKNRRKIVAKMFNEGLSLSTIAKSLGMKPSTIRKDFKNISPKLIE